MKVHEYQAKELLARYGVPVPKGRVTHTIDEAEMIQNVKTVAAEYAAAKAAGNFDVAAVIAGEAVGLIHDIPPAAEIVERIATEAEQILQGRRNSVMA